MNLSVMQGVHDGGDVVYGGAQAQVEETVEQRLDVF
jgi:hypothetical protein